MEGRPINAKKRQNAWFRLSGGEKLREEKGEGYVSRPRPSISLDA